MHHWVVAGGLILTLFKRSDCVPKQPLPHYPAGLFLSRKSMLSSIWIKVLMIGFGLAALDAVCALFSVEGVFLAISAAIDQLWGWRFDHYLLLSTC